MHSGLVKAVSAGLYNLCTLEDFSEAKSAVKAMDAPVSVLECLVRFIYTANAKESIEVISGCELELLSLCILCDMYQVKPLKDAAVEEILGLMDKDPVIAFTVMREMNNLEIPKNAPVVELVCQKIDECVSNISLIYIKKLVLQMAAVSE